MPTHQDNPSVRFGGATARSADDWATRFGPYSRERVSMDGNSVSTRQRKGNTTNRSAAQHNAVGSLVRGTSVAGDPLDVASLMCIVLAARRGCGADGLFGARRQRSVHHFRCLIRTRELGLGGISLSRAELCQCPARHRCDVAQGADKAGRTSRSRPAPQAAQPWCRQQTLSWTRAGLSAPRRGPGRQRRCAVARSTGLRQARQVRSAT